MKIIFKILITLLLFSCQPKQEKIVQYAITKSDGRMQRHIDLDKIQTYKELSKFIEKTICANEIPVLDFDSGKIKKELKPVNNCEIIKWDPSPKNIITITKSDSIMKFDYLYPLDSLASILKQDFLPSSIDSDFSSSPDKLILIIKRRHQAEISKLKLLLNKITEEYDKIDTQIELKIFFDLNNIPPPKSN